MIVLFILISFLVLHAIYNLVNYLRFPYVEKLLMGNYCTDVDLSMRAKTHKNRILNYIKNSGVKDKSIPITQATGHGQIVNANISIFSNMLNPRQDVASTVFNLLLEAKGNYWSKFINTFNPFYWLRIILFIPKYLFSYLGLKDDSLVIKIFQLMYWLIGTIATVALAVFPEEIKAFIFSILHIT